MTDSQNTDRPGSGGDDPQTPGTPDHAAQQHPVGEHTDDHTAKLGAAAPTDESPRAYSQLPRTETAQFGPGHTGGFDAQSDGFAPIPPEAQTGVVSTSPAKKRSTGKIVALSSVAVILMLVIAAVGSELYLRNKATDCMESAFTELTGTETTVSLSRKPMLLQGFGNDIPFVQIDTVDEPGEMRLHARAEGITGEGDSSTIRSLTGTGFVPFDRVVAMSQQATAGADPSTSGNGQSGAGGLMQGASIETMTGNAADGTIQVDSAVQVAFLPIPVSTTIRPVLQEGRVDFEVVKASAFIFGIPSDFAQQVVDSVSESLFGPLFDEVTVQSMQVTDQGVDFAVDGQDVALSGEMTGGSGDCSAA
ncbi:hypothetical protein V1Y59_02995 [Gordonia sp. PKS22-38]|uniref:DUF2993 domain-containing protein n=1 Tax=Gordonia prachuapensis TaxID=3115651 RepID=A0ABU7MNY8_9ACTN|nr:hypothetical protein [Gordonia sp. PKS22-38]